MTSGVLMILTRSLETLSSTHSDCSKAHYVDWVKLSNENDLKMYKFVSTKLAYINT